jgi:hypothetical protein
MSGPGDSPNCLNCGAHLTGQYCGQCGQRAVGRFISIWQLLSDAFGDLFELDSRLWRTMIPLLIRPGLLTKDYLEGRRARYMPPFRMYLVLSVLFFVVAFFNPRDDLAIFYEPVVEPTVELVAEEESTQENSEEDDPEEDNSDFLNDCSIGEIDLSEAPEWLERRITAERLEAVCDRVQVIGQTGLKKAVLENIPAALIVLLPIMAFVLKLLYPLSRRYYVEHLLFFVHFHSFMFFILTLQILITRLGEWIGFVETLFSLIVIAATLYIPVYMFVAMRHVYGQRRALTFVKYVPLVIAYAVLFIVLMLTVLVVTVFSI